MILRANFPEIAKSLCKALRFMARRFSSGKSYALNAATRALTPAGRFTMIYLQRANPDPPVPEFIELACASTPLEYLRRTTTQESVSTDLIVLSEGFIPANIPAEHCKGFIPASSLKLGDLGASHLLLGDLGVSDLLLLCSQQNQNHAGRFPFVRDSSVSYPHCPCSVRSRTQCLYCLIPRYCVRERSSSDHSLPLRI